VHDAAGDGMEERGGTVRREERVGRALVGRVVIGLGLDAAEDEVRGIEAAQRRDARQELAAMPPTTRRVVPRTSPCRPQKLVTPAAVPMPPRKP
jgi:hypothetical protein